MNPAANENSIKFGKTYKEINNSFDEKITQLFLNNPEDVKKVTIVWECQFIEMKKKLN